MAEDCFVAAISGIDVAGALGPYQGKLISEISVATIRAARRVSDGMEAMQLTVTADSLSGIAEWPRSAGFEIACVPEEPGNAHSRIQIFLQLTEGRYREVFLALCSNICSVLKSSASEREAVRAFYSRIIRWQSFLKHNSLDGLGEEAQVGLFGELHILREVFLPRIDATVALQAWRGCKGAHQDFQFASRAMEVKTSRASILDRIAISNVQQLDEDGMILLVLTVVQVHANETAGETLPEMVRELRGRLQDEPLELFEEGLMAVGYLNIHKEKYDRTRYQVSDVIHHEVRDGFPRLLRGNRPGGVKKVRYEISIDAARAFRVEEAAVYEIFREGDGGTGN